MLDKIDAWLPWIPWLVGGTTLSLIALIVIAFVGGGTAMKILSTIVDALAPLLKGAADGVVWFIKKLGEGGKICLTNPPTFAVIFVALIVGGYFLTDVNPSTLKAKAQLSQLKKENAEFKKKAAKIPTRKAAAKPTDFWSGWTL